MKTCYEDWRLKQLTQAQIHTIERVGADIIVLAVTGVAKVIARKSVYLIARNGKITYQGRRGWMR